eukprot:Ihof_evm8s60 gene=Ihof_evmTU8s60
MQIKVTYFDMHGRAESTRLALHIGGIPFEDERLTHEQFATIKETLPFGQLPILTVDGKVLAQSRSMLRFAGNLAGLYPTDSWAAAQVDEVVDAIDDIIALLVPSFHIDNPEEKIKMRAEIAANVWPKWFTAMEKYLKANGTGYYVSDKLTVADIQAYVMFSWFSS